MYKYALTCKKCVPRDKENNSNWRGGISANTARYKKIQASRYPERTIARRMVKEAIKNGKIARQPCEVCGAEPADAHHEDYSKPLNIRWLCETHHRQAHGGMKWYRSKG